MTIYQVWNNSNASNSTADNHAEGTVAKPDFNDFETHVVKKQFE